MPASAHDRIENPLSIQQNERVKLADKTDYVNSIQLTVNGRKYTVIRPDPKMVLNEWLRDQLHLKGTKMLCGEGGCGACVVAVSQEDPMSHPETIKAVNSCLCPLLSLDGHHVITVEGLGGKKDGFHDIQKRFAENFASQCGFCTPGFVMNGYSLLVSSANGKTKQALEDSFDGNICRCTGYRPILDAMKSFAVSNDVLDIEDIRSCKGCKSSCKKTTIIDFSNEEQSESIWLTPKCFSSLFHMMQQLRGKKIKFVAGSTGAGVFKNEGDFDAYIDIKQLKELSSIEMKNNCLEVGSIVTLTGLINFMENNVAVSKSFAVFAEHIKKLANVPVRNVATWAGNLMLNHAHNNFPSDIYLIFAAANAQLVIADMNGNIMKCSFEEFMLMSMESKIILLLILPLSEDDEVFQTYKVMPRKQNSYAYVNAGFRASVDKESLTFKGKPTLMFGGVGLKMARATNLEEYLQEKNIDDERTFQDSLRLLEDELMPNPENKLVDFDYCKNVAINLFYKFFLLLRGQMINESSQNGIEPFDRPISSGSQSFHVNESVAPLNQPCQRIEGKLQASGEVLFVDDLPKHPNEAYAAFVLSDVACAELKDVDISEAEKHPGFLAVLTHNDIPGTNNFLPHGNYTEEILATKDIEYAGQPVAIVVATSQRAAKEIVKLVSVEYANVCKPILTLDEAIEKESFHAGNPPPNIIGNTEDAFEKCDHVITGEGRSGAQHHFYIEPMTCFVMREEHDYKVFTSTQSTKDVQEAISNALSINSASVDVQVTRIGGGFGGKFQYPPLIAAAAAVAAKSLDRPIRLTLSLDDNLRISGTRAPFLTKYKVGFSDEGHLEACEADVYVDAGKSMQCDDGCRAALWMDNAYFCPNWKISVTNCKTSKPFSTFFRGPGNLQGTFVTETILDHVASYLQKETTEEIKEINFYQNGQMSIRKIPVADCLLNKTWAKIQQKAEYKKRRTELIEFNKESRWRKRGIAVMPMKYDINYHCLNFSALVSVYYGDGTVAISQGGIEMGQGINTRVRSVAAAKLGIPVGYVSVKPHSTLTAANSFETGASVTSEINCLAVYKCCEMLLERIAPLKERFPHATWKELINECAKAKVNLSAQYQYYDDKKRDYAYSVYGAACSEAEVDLLTGETHILRTDIVYDSGESINPRLDVGQIEGAFVQGMGYWLSEKVAYDEDSGRQLTAGTWDYKPPMSKDIPVDMRVSLMHEVKNPVGHVRSKAVGEPAICMAESCLFAVKNAIKAARKELDQPSTYFALDGPATIDKIQKLCKVDKDLMDFI